MRNYKKVKEKLLKEGNVTINFNRGDILVHKIIGKVEDDKFKYLHLVNEGEGWITALTDKFNSLDELVDALIDILKSVKGFDVEIS